MILDFISLSGEEGEVLINTKDIQALESAKCTRKDNHTKSYIYIANIHVIGVRETVREIIEKISGK